MGAYHNLATDRVFEEAKSSLFLRKDDPASKLEAYVAINPHADRQATVQLDEKQQARAEEETTDGTVGIDRKVILSSSDALAAYTRRSRPLSAFIIRKRNSYAQLSISFELFDQLCEEISISRKFRDYLVYYGRRQFEVEIAPPPFSLETPSQLEVNCPPEWEAMGVVRFMEENAKTSVSNPSERWSIRQTAVYFRFDRQQSRAVWLFLSPSSSVEALLGGIWASAKYERQRPWQTLHALFFFAACNWRPYIVALMHEVEEHELNLLGTSPNNSGPMPLPEAEERQALLILEKQISTALLAIQSTKADVEFLLEELLAYQLEPQDWRRSFTEVVRHINVNTMRLDAIRSRLQNLTGLVSSFLDLSSGYALQGLTEESRRENQAMRKLNEKMAVMAEKNAEEAVTVTVLALLTMVYLPFTVVSNFFSTSFVGTGNNRIYVTPDSWILFVISVPLTFGTVYVWRVWTQIKVRRRYPFWWSLLGLKPAKPPLKDYPVEDYGNYGLRAIRTNSHIT